jgi:hypothetical protein
MPTVNPPLPIRIASREEGGIVFWELIPSKLASAKPSVEQQVLFTVDRALLDEMPWLFDQMNLLAYKVGQVKLQAMGYVSAVQQVGAAVEPQPESTIILDPIAEKKQGH